MNKSIFKVPDISCQHCKVAIEGEVSKLDGVEGVKVDVTAKQVAVEGQASREAVIGAIGRAGYKVVGATT